MIDEGLLSPRAQDRLRLDREEFAAIARRWRVREPVKRADGLVGPLNGIGTCLEPLLSGASHVWFDQELEPRDGDLVLVKYSDEWIARVLDYVSRESDEYQAQWRESNCVDGVMPRIAAKILRIRDGVSWLLCADYAIRVDQVGRVVGVARHIEQDRVPILGSSGARRFWHYWPAIPVAIAVILILNSLWSVFT